MKAVVKSDQTSLKKPCHLKNNVYVLCSPRTVVIEPANSKKTDTNIILKLPDKARAFITTKYRGQEIQKVDKKTKRVWIEILNESYFEKLVIKNKAPHGFLVIEPENLKVRNEAKKAKNNEKAIYLKTGVRRGNNTGRKKKRPRQRGSFLNRFCMCW